MPTSRVPPYLFSRAEPMEKKADQQAVIEFLSCPAAHGGSAVERIDTHTALVFLAGARAWKMKRAVKFDYVDFSSLERRREMCEAEVRVNRRTAPRIYRGVVPVTEDPHGVFMLGGRGRPVEWLVQMERFDQDRLFDRLAVGGELAPALMEALATEVARLHAIAEPRRDHGGRDGMAWVVRGNAEGFQTFGAGAVAPEVCVALTTDALDEVDRLGALLDRRRDEGFVRQCHGDLHLRNIVLCHGEPTVFDAIEFNDELACIDVFYDLAFLLMDLWKRSLSRQANLVFNRYLLASGDIEGVALLPLFLSCRAAIRAKTSLTAAAFANDATRRQELGQRAREYLAMAGRLLRRPAPRLIAVGGWSGSGKSTLARQMAPSIGAVPGALLLRSDEIRKQLCGVGPLDRLGREGYRTEVSVRVYQALADRAVRALRAGHSVIVDAVFARPDDRQRVEHMAAMAGVPFRGVWLEAPPEVLVARAGSRVHDASDADPAIVREQLTQSAGAIEWPRVDASQPLRDVERAARAVLAVGEVTAA